MAHLVQKYQPTTGMNMVNICQQTWNKTFYCLSNQFVNYIIAAEN